MATLKDLLTIIISKLNSKVTTVNGASPDDSGNVEVQSGVQSDWNQNDETAIDYVKNRPFYTGDTVEILLCDICEEMTSAGVDWINNDSIMVTGVDVGVFMYIDKQISIGDYLKFVVNGNSYTCIAQDASDLVSGTIKFVEENTQAVYVSLVPTTISESLDQTKPYVISVAIVVGSTAPTEFKIIDDATEIVQVDTKYIPAIPAGKLPEIPAGKLPEIPAEKLPEIPAEKLPEIPAEKLSGIDFSKVIGAPFIISEFGYNYKTYTGSTSGTYIKCQIYANDLSGSGFYKISNDVYTADKIKEIQYTLKFSSGPISSLHTKTNISDNAVYAYNDKSIFIVDVLLFCGSTGDFTLTVNNRRINITISEKGIYAYKQVMSSYYNYPNYVKIALPKYVIEQTYNEIVVPSSNTNSTKKFKITLDDSGVPTFADTSDSTIFWTPTDELPTVTSEDAGKFLRVSSTGEWAAESISNAEGASF